MLAWLWQFILQPLGLGGVKGKALASRVGAAPTLSASVGGTIRHAGVVSTNAVDAGSVNSFP
ncbi:MAG TPA: hypothetical protein VGX76_15725 [Pirellulales bacterium]|jgi:hypothetical protein|nr:hypothetical protein [Pirellulales bacterium]